MKIIIVDDHPLMQKGLSSVFMTEPECEVAGQAVTVCEAMELIQKVRPDLVTLDLRLKGEHGLDVIRMANAKCVKCKFIIVTSSLSKKDFEDAQQLGVDGYILKDALPEEILYAAHIVSRGKKYIDPDIIETLLDEHNKVSVDGLTPREYDVLSALSKGMSNKEIARRLYITEYTVKKHVSRILYKLNLKDRTQAAIYANSRGLVS